VSIIPRGFVNPNFEYLYLRNKHGCTLGLVFTNEPDLVCDVTAIQNLGSSDHNMAALLLTCIAINSIVRDHSGTIIRVIIML